MRMKCVGLKADLRDVRCFPVGLKADAHRMKLAYALEVQGRVSRIGLEQRERLVRESLDPSGQRAVAGPEIRGSVVVQSFVDLPEACSSLARAPKASSFPEEASASNCRSQSRASNSANHRRNEASSSVERSWICRSMSSIRLMGTPTADFTMHDGPPGPCFILPRGGLPHPRCGSGFSDLLWVGLQRSAVGRASARRGPWQCG